MKNFQLSTSTWKWLISALALFSAVLITNEFRHASGPLWQESHGTIGAVLVDQIGADNNGHGTHLLRIAFVDKQSELGIAGAVKDDSIRFDRYQNRWRKYAAEEKVGLTLYKDGGARHFVISPHMQKITFAEYFDYISRFMLAVFALGFGVLIAFQQPERPAYRALSTTFIALSLVGFFYSFSYSPDGALFTISKAVAIVSYSLSWYWCVVFALSYQEYDRVGLRLWLTGALPWYRILAFGTALYAVGYALGKETPMLWLATLLCAVLGVLLFIVSLVDGWRRSSGEIHQRHLWLLLSSALGTVPTVLTLIPQLSVEVHEGLRLTVAAYFVGQFLMYAGLTYSVLQHRVFNFDFAISRVLVFSVVSVMLLCVFGLIEWKFADWHAHNPRSANQSLAVGAALALAVYLVLHHVHHRIERRVEKLLFRKWHISAHRLNAYVRQAEHFTTMESLLDSFCDALDRFTGDAGCAIYLRQDSGEYTFANGSLAGAPAFVDSNDSIAVALRAEPEPLLIDQMHTALRGDMVLPMCRRGVLDGFVLVGGKRSRQSYRPDQIDALGVAAHRIALDLHALRVDKLERELGELERKAGKQGQELALMAGRRRGSRSATEPDATAVSA